MRSIHGNLGMSEAFAKADDILAVAAKGIAEIITVAGYVNVDFEDVNTVMRNSGVAIMGTAVAEGEDRAKKAVDLALTSPLLEDNNIYGAKHILLNISSGSKEVTMDEITQITEFVQAEAGVDTNLIWGNCYEESLGDKLCVTVIATGFERNQRHKEGSANTAVVVTLDDDHTSPSLMDILDESDRSLSYGQGVIEFENSSRFRNSLYSNDEPYLKPGSKQDEHEVFRPETHSNVKRTDFGRISEATKGGSQKVFADMENEPAYIRKKVDLESVAHSGEDVVPRYSINEDGEPSYNPNRFFNGKAD